MHGGCGHTRTSRQTAASLAPIRIGFNADRDRTSSYGRAPGQARTPCAAGVECCDSGVGPRHVPRATWAAIHGFQMGAVRL